MRIRLPTGQRWATYLTLLTVAGSGLFWSLLHDILQSGYMLVERDLLVVHGIAAAVTLVIVGGLLPLHIRLAWRAGRNMASGTIALSAIAVLGTTGLLLYYGGEEWLDETRWAHIVVGILASAALPTHIWMGRKRPS